MMDNLTQQEKDAVKAGLILAVLLLAGAFWYEFKFVQPALKKNETTMGTLRDEIRGLDEEIRAMDLAEENMKLLQEKIEILQRVAQKLPKSIDPQGFWNALRPMLEVTRVDYSELNPEKPLEREIYTEIPYSIACKARYHDFGHFLNLVEENPNRLMRIKTFNIENSDDRPSMHPITVQIATFMFKQV